MRYTAPQILGVICALWGLAAQAQDVPQIARGESCEVVAIPGGLQCHTEALERSGDVVWEMQHPALYDDPAAFEERQGGATPIGLSVMADGRVFYAVHADLLEIDSGRGQIVGRVQFPGLITRVSVAPKSASALEVRLQDSSPGRAAADEVIVAFEPGDMAPSRSPGRGFWGVRSTMGAARDAMWRADVPLARGPERDAALQDRTPLDDEALVLMMTLLQRVDPTNLYVAAIKADALMRLESPERAEAAAMVAAKNVHAHWLDLLRVSVFLEWHGFTGAAELAFERGQQAMADAGVRGERVPSLLAMYLIFMSSGDALRDAIARGDVELADAVASRITRALPHLEGAPGISRMLAAWLEGQGDEERAEQWRERAALAELAPTMARSRLENQRAIDRFILAMFALLLASLILALVVGVRAGIRRGRKPVEGRRLMPRVMGSELVALGLLLAALMVLPFIVTHHFYIDTLTTNAPIEMTQDAYGTSLSITWLSSLAPGSARDALLDYANAERAALEGGGRLELEPPIASALTHAIHTDSRALGIRPFYEAMPPGVAYKHTPWLHSLSRAGLSAVAILSLALGWALLLFLLSILGQVMGRKLPRLADLFLAVIPGAATGLGAAGGLVLTVFVASLLGMSSLANLTELSTITTAAALFGLGELSPQSGLASNLWPVMGVVLGAGVQVGALAWQWRRARS